MISCGQFPSVIILRTGTYPEESIQHSKHGESFKQIMTATHHVITRKSAALEYLTHEPLGQVALPTQINSLLHVLLVVFKKP